jgi:DNA-binding transcriptional regulator YhcF (GntR family)
MGTTTKAPPEVVLAVIRWHLERFGYAPTVREIALELDVAISTAAVALDELEKAGAIERQRGKARAIRIIDEREPR